MRKPRHRNSTRDRERAELTSLRSLVHELESHVAASCRGEVSPLESRRSAWQSLSERQARARAAAEETNRALNERVQSNADWIQRLWELLHEKRRASETSSGLRRMAALQRKAEDDLVLSQLKQQAHSAAPQVPNILVEHGVHLFGDRCGVQADVWSHTRSGWASTLVCARRVPFDAHSTSAAVWRALSRPEGSFASEGGSLVGFHEVTSKARVLERTADVCAMKLREQIQGLSQEPMLFNYHAVVQRAALKELQSTSVFVWKSLFTLADGSTKHHDSMWAAVAPCGLESIVAIVCESQLQMTLGSDELISVQDLIMPGVEACVNNIFSAAEDKLLKEDQDCASHSSTTCTSESSEAHTINV